MITCISVIFSWGVWNHLIQTQFACLVRKTNVKNPSFENRFRKAASMLMLFLSCCLTACTASLILLPLLLANLWCFGRRSRLQVVFLTPPGCKAKLLGAPTNLTLSTVKEMGILAAGQPEGLLPLALLLLSIVLGVLPWLLPELEAPAQLLLMLLLAQMPFLQLSG